MIFNRYARGGGGGGLGALIYVTVDAGSTVVATKGTTTRNAVYSQGVYVIDVPSFGDWVVTATKDGKSASETVSVTKAGMYEVTLMYVSTTLNDNDWAKIRKVANTNTGANYWSVGDTKEITINGKLSDGLTLSNYSTYVYIIGFDHNSSREGAGIAFQGFKTAQTGGVDIALVDSGYGSSKTSGTWFNMNNSQSNAGGWSSSRMRSTILPQVKSCLPSDLTAVIKTTTLYSDNTGGGSNTASYVTSTQDTLYLLAEYEIFGTRSYANSAEQNYQKQYAYYSAGNSKVKYKHNSTGTTCAWWERSVLAFDSGDFCHVYTGGTAGSNLAHYSNGLAPCFKVGGATLNDFTWSEIKAISDAGTASNYFSIGDTKQITINGTLSDGLTLDNYSTWVYIIGIDHNKDVEGTGTAFQGFKTAQQNGTDIALVDSGYFARKTSGTWFNMNNSDTNSGGWASCRMRTVTLPQVKDCLPSDLQSAIKTTTLYSDNTGGSSASYVTSTQDTLYLLAEWEVFGLRTYANSAEQNYQKQYAYYSAGNSKVKYRHNATTTTCTWWERSTIASTSDLFCIVTDSGTAEFGYAISILYPLGLALAFKV